VVSTTGCVTQRRGHGCKEAAVVHDDGRTAPLSPTALEAADKARIGGINKE
jgi:hypothetical protein